MRCTTVTNQKPKVTRRMSAGFTLRLSRMSRKMALTLLILAIFRALVIMIESRTAAAPPAAGAAPGTATASSQAKGRAAIRSTANQPRR